MVGKKTFKPGDLSDLRKRDVSFYGLNTRAREEDRRRLFKRIVAFISALAFVASAIIFLVAYILLQGGAFSVRIDPDSISPENVAISRTENFDQSQEILLTPAKNEMVDVSYAQIYQEDPDKYTNDDKDYMHTMFYMKNIATTENQLDFRYTLAYTDATFNIASAIRILIVRHTASKVFLGDEIYAMPKTDGSAEQIAYDGYGKFGEKEGIITFGALARNYAKAKNFQTADKFSTHNTVCSEYITDLGYGEVIRFDIIVWLEGTDEDCTYDVNSGRLKFIMTITAIEPEYHD